MAIYQESRYETADVIPLPDRTGVYRATIIPTRTVRVPDSYSVHRVVTGERLDTLASRAYSDAELWWIIADANPELSYPDDLVPGSLIRIPSFASVNP